MTVIIYGDKKEKNLNNIIIKILTRYGGVQFHSKDKIICSKDIDTPKFLVYELNELPKVLDVSGLIIFRDSFKKLDSNKLSNNIFPIFDNQNLEAANCFKDTNKIVLTCGLSSKNTLNISSISSTDAVLSLQRYVKIKNKVLEPHEIKINLTMPIKSQDILMLCAILLLSDIPSENGYIF